MSKRVLGLLFDGFEEIETVAPVDLLRRAGADVVIATVATTLDVVTGRCGIRIFPDILLDEIEKDAADNFDMLLLPGGPGVRALREDGRAARLATRFAKFSKNSPKIVAAICAAPLILKDAGLLGAGRRFTAHDSVWTELPGVLKTERVVEDGNIITSRGAGTAIEFSLALVRRLYGGETASEIAKAIVA